LVIDTGGEISSPESKDTFNNSLALSLFELFFLISDSLSRSL